MRPDATFLGGHSLSGLITDAAGTPVRHTDLNIFDATSGRRAFTPWDDTDFRGEFTVVLGAGAYNMVVRPPKESDFLAVRIVSVSLTCDVALRAMVLLPGSRLTGAVLDPIRLPVAGAEPRFADSAAAQFVLSLRDNTDAAGSFSTILPAGRFTGSVAPPADSGFGSAVIPEFGVSGSTQLPAVQLPASGPAVFSLTPLRGPTLRGTLVEVQGQSFEAGTVFSLSGRSAELVSLEGTTRTVLRTRSHPEGFTSLEAQNPDGGTGSLVAAFFFAPGASPVSLSVSLSGSDVVFTWASTGQSLYTVFRSANPRAFGDAEVRMELFVPGYVDPVVPPAGTVFFYHVE